MSEKIIKKNGKILINTTAIQAKGIFPMNRWRQVIKEYEKTIPFAVFFKEGRFVCYDIDFAFEKYKENLEKEAKEKINKKLKKAENKIKKLKNF